ncbi:NACHT domain-containing protein [Streptomyces sp. NPDC093261]|uniref:NACHT domain-containing protein n=1 Tax=Streptomyces sp. NPDC093261 TaxID=3366037 RepID=UPI003801E6DF
MDYDLTRLGTREFEHLTQALAVRVLGAGVEVFGDGPDGGREAAFRGRMRYPEPASEGNWDGYGVLQAKFRARPLGTQLDTAWFLAQAKAELTTWANPKSKRARAREIPRYVLFATNVVLSPVAEVGGIDTVKREIDALIAKLKLPIRGWRVWHYDQLNTLLDNYPAVRQPYEALITSGDVLAHLHRMLEGSGAIEIAERATTYSVMQLKADRHVRLHQAGEGDNQRLNLSDIAIDLKAYVDNLDPFDQQIVNTAEYVLKRGNTILRPSYSGDESPRHCVILGGPGQGKTTLSQLICQAYRVAFLAESPALLSGEQQELLSRMKSHLGEIGVPAPAQHRWPARIDLADYSDVIAGGENVSILKYLAQRMNESAPEVSANHLRAWLGKWPWLLVLDGLDEVASSASRESVISKLDDFYTEARQLDSDLFVVATSRPQGYRQEFSDSVYTHLSLKPLEPGEAVAYAELLAHARYPGDSETARQVYTRLQSAASEEITARLMRTPLQVTIMSVLLERRERVPQERYRLFDAYYETIYNREVGKPGPVGRLLDQHRTTIGRIHQQVGLQLHVLAENAGEHGAAMPIEQLQEVAQQILSSAGYDDEKSSRKLVDQLVNAATTRLVLLAPQGDGFGFDVRSLQEFMAAQAIARDQATDISERLRIIAWSAHWRNTWLLAAGNVFFHQGRQRHNLINLLREIQIEDELSLLVKPGSLIALELLDDDVAAATPKFRRLLVQQALELLDLPPGGRIGSTLARVLSDSVKVDPGCKPIVYQAIERAISSTGMPAVAALDVLRSWSIESTPEGARARRLMEKMRRTATPAIQGFGESCLRCWAAKDTEERNELLSDVLNLSGNPEDDSTWEATEWCRDIGVTFKLTSRGVWVAETVTGPAGESLYHTQIPEVRAQMIETALRSPVEHAVIASVLRRWILSWAERRPCGTSLLDSVARDELGI